LRPTPPRTPESSELDDTAGPLSQAVDHALGPEGLLAMGDPDFRPRTTQRRMARAVARAIEEVETVVIEAGTGIGKTFGYLVPVLLSGRRALISTATRALQDQLFLRDLPRLVSRLGRPVRSALLKGRSSYLCLHRLGQIRPEDRLPDRESVGLLARVERWSRTTNSGDLAEVDGLEERSVLVPLITSTRDNCLGAECPKWSSCHLVRARREAMAADVVVVNHHLFFADVALRDSGVAELLPTVDLAVFDEAHHLVDVGLQFLGTACGTAQLGDFSRDLVQIGQRRAPGLQPWVELAAQIEAAARQIRHLCVRASLRPASLPMKLGWDQVEASPLWSTTLASSKEALSSAASAAAQVEASAPDLRRLRERAETLAQIMQRFSLPADKDVVRWVDVSMHSARLVESPLDIRGCMDACRHASPKAWIFTSATLGDDPELSWFTSATGSEAATILRVDSPFDYPAQARVWVPRAFPAPRDPRHPAEVGDLAAHLARVLAGRTFVLTTSLRALEPIAQALRNALGEETRRWQVLVQGHAPRRALLERYGNGRFSVLLGSQGFWEGIDVPGDALQCVVIDKLPFPTPTDPLTQARVRQVESRGGRAFEECFLAEAAVSLKQGAGRLIRTESDRGLLVVCDARLATMPYGRRLREALPGMTPLETRSQAVDWLETLSATTSGSYRNGQDNAA
jgi:ATP-dependent DNA helicase DinG